VVVFERCGMQLCAALLNERGYCMVKQYGEVIPSFDIRTMLPFYFVSCEFGICGLYLFG
jgi:hypothetical protein